VAEIVGIIFRGGIKVYHFDPRDWSFPTETASLSRPAVVRRSARCRTATHYRRFGAAAPLKKVVRVATGKDLETQAANEGLRRQAMDTCRELIAEHGLDMKLVGADIGFGGEKITFSFFSEEAGGLSLPGGPIWPRHSRCASSCAKWEHARRPAWSAGWVRAAGACAARCSPATMIRCPSAWPRSRTCPSTP